MSGLKNIPMIEHLIMMMILASDIFAQVKLVLSMYTKAQSMK